MKQNKDFVRNGVNGYSSVNNASCTEAQQWRKYHSPNGHGFAAEDANAINDSLHGKKVDKIGINNELNGADRIVNGVPIQTKYCQSASKSVNNAFGANGYYRYPGKKLEVPKEQYEEAIRLMAEKIRNGKVPGVTDPAQAKEMVVKGSVTYKEAVNIAKAGNIDSIKFDMKTQAVSCGIACGISFLLVYANARYRGRNSQEALKEAMKVAVQSGVTTMAVGVATQQMLRTAMGRQVAAAATKVSRHAVDTVCRTQIGKAIVHKLMESMLGKQLTQVAARNAVIGMARTNVITGAAMTIATSVPDFIKAGRGKMSWKQFGKNSAVNAAGVGGGLSGAWLGAAIGSFILPGVGTAIGGLIGGMGGGVTASCGAKKAIDHLVDDDAKEIITYLEEVITELCHRYNKDEASLQSILQKMKSNKVFSQKFFENAYKAGGREQNRHEIKRYLTNQLRPYFA